MTARSASLLPVAALLLNALIWGLSWWPFRLLQGHGLHPLWSTALAYALGVVIALVWKPGTVRAFFRHPGLWGLALAAGLCNAGFNWAVTSGDVVRVVLLFYMMPVWSVLLAWPLLGEKPTLPALSRLSLALVGVVVVLKSPGSPWPLPRDGYDALALAAGVAFALTTISLRRLEAAPPQARALAMFGGGAVMAGGVALVGGSFGLATALPPPSAGWLLPVAGLGLALMLANISLQFGAARLRAGTTSLVMLSEVVFASLSAVALGAAQVDTRTLIGGGLIMAAVLLASWAEAEHHGASPP